MLVAVSDTHSRSDPELPPRVRTAAEDAELVFHTGDFTTERVLDGFEDQARELVAVSGNRDRPGVRERVPETTTSEWAGLRFLLAHGHKHDSTSLSLLARQEDADVLVTGHTHRPVIDTVNDLPHVNPGSYADPRGNRPAYAVFEQADGGVRATLRALDGEPFRTELL